MPPFLRRITFLTSFVIVAVVASTPRAAAQDVRQITFEEAVQIALQQNVNLRQSENLVDLDARRVFQRQMDFLPDLRFSTNGIRGSGFTQDQAGRNIAFTNSTLSGTFSTSLNLFNGFADVASLEQARHEYDASALTYDRNRQNVVFAVVDNYLAYISSQERIRIQQENVEAQRQQLAQIEEFVNVGARPISDLYQQQAAVAQAEFEVLNAQRQAELNKTRLIQVLHLDPFGSYEFEAPSVDETIQPRNQYELESLLLAAYQMRPDIRAQEEQILAAREGIRIARSQYYPRVDLNAGYRSNFSPDAEGGLWDQIDANRGNNIGFSLSFPIFDRFTRGTNVQQAEVVYRNERLELETLRQDVALQVRQAYLDYLIAEKRVDVAETQLRAAQQALDAAEERYNVGAGTLVELSQARAQFVEAASNRAQARVDLLFQSRLVDYHTGRLDPNQDLFSN